MFIRQAIRSAVYRWRLNKLRRQGLQIADDVILAGMPMFGSEPYLISIAEKVRISGNVAFITHDGATGLFRHQPKYEKVRRFGRITIHENCFIGYRAVIMPGVTIGPNSIVGANALVIADVPPNTVVWGAPARPIMTVDAFAEKCLANNLEYDENRYVSDRKAELLRLFPYPW